MKGGIIATVEQRTETYLNGSLTAKHNTDIPFSNRKIIASSKPQIGFIH